MWLARNRQGVLYAFNTKPFYVSTPGRTLDKDGLIEYWCTNEAVYHYKGMKVDSFSPVDETTEITFDNSPVEVIVKIKRND